MEEYMKKRKKNPVYKKNGFTLVELVVVLAILGILASITVPALLGFIDRGKEKELIINGQNAYLAAETLAGESFSSGEAYPTAEQVTELAQVPGTVTELCLDEKKGRVKATLEEPFCYEEAGQTARLADGSWEVIEE